MKKARNILNDFVRRNLLTSSLQRLELSKDSQTILLQFLTLSYPLYVDRASRQAVQECLRTLVADPAAEEHWEKLTSFLDIEASKGITLAPASVFVLLEWCSVLLQEIARNPKLWSSWGLKVVLPQAQLLENCMGTSTRDGRKSSALVTSRRGLRTIAKNSEMADTAMNDIISTLTTKGTTSTAGNALLLGVVAGVCDRLPSMQAVLERRATDYFAFYIREIISSRVQVPVHIANALRDFFGSSAVPATALEDTIIPAFEKALLRAPEIVLDDLMTPFVSALPASIDLSKPFKTNLLKPLLSNIKSTNPKIRDGALSAFEAVNVRCSDTQTLSDVVDEVLKSFKEAKAADQRMLYAQMLTLISLSDSSMQKIANGLTPLILKEANESALAAETKALSCCAIYALSHDKAVEAGILKAFVQGLSDKKPTVRRVWAQRCGEIAWSLDATNLNNAASIGFFEGVLEKLIIIWDEVISNPLAAAQSGLVTAAYVLIAISFSKLKGVESPKINNAVKKAGVATVMIGSESKPSFLVNHRIYSKATTVEDLTWTLRALSAVTGQFGAPTLPASLGPAWAQAFIYLLTAAIVPALVRHEASLALAEALVQNPEQSSDFVVEGLWQWLRSCDLDEKDTPATAAKSGRDRLHLVLQTVCSSQKSNESQGKTINPSALRGLLLKILVLSREPLVPRVQWIELCLRSGIDPKTLVSEHSEGFMEEIIRHTEVGDL